MSITIASVLTLLMFTTTSCTDEVEIDSARTTAWLPENCAIATTVGIDGNAVSNVTVYTPAALRTTLNPSPSNNAPVV